MLNVNKRLDAMIFYNPVGKIISQQYFKKYINNKGVEFPTEITMISVNEKGEKNIKLTTYKFLDFIILILPKTILTNHMRSFKFMTNIINRLL